MLKTSELSWSSAGGSNARDLRVIKDGLLSGLEIK